MREAEFEKKVKKLKNKNIKKEFEQLSKIAGSGSSIYWVRNMLLLLSTQIEKIEKKQKELETAFGDFGKTCTTLGENN